MDFNYNICFYEVDDGLLSSRLNLENFKCLGFESKMKKGCIQELLSYISLNKFDILVINLFDVDKERFSYFLDIVYNNFCDKVLIISDSLFDNSNVYQLIINDDTNFDLKLQLKLMDIKRDIQSCPWKNIDFLKSKVNNILASFQFSSRHDGFKYYLDAIILAYMKQPEGYLTMDLYKEVANHYGKSICAVEKSMRMALIYAFNKLKNAPQTPENDKLRSYLTYDLNNNTAISMMLNMLMQDKTLKEALIENKELIIKR